MNRPKLSVPLNYGTNLVCLWVIQESTQSGGWQYVLDESGHVVGWEEKAKSERSLAWRQAEDRKAGKFVFYRIVMLESLVSIRPPQP